jgi:hypothetical protein
MTHSLHDFLRVQNLRIRTAIKKAERNKTFGKSGLFGSNKNLIPPPPEKENKTTENNIIPIFLFPIFISNQ